MIKNRAKLPFNPAKFPFFYGYIIFLCASFGMLISGPGQTIGVSAFTDSLIENLHISRFQLSIAYMIGTVASSIFIGRAGKSLDNYSVRRVVSVTVIGLGVFLFYMAYCDKIAEYLGGGVAIGMLVVTFGFWMIRFFGQGVLALASRTMLMKWYDKKRGRANAFLGIFIVVTFSFIPAIFNYLKNLYDWRGAWMIAGCVSIGYIIFVLIFYRDKPEDCGLLPDGVSEEEFQKELEATAKEDIEEEWEYGEVKRNYTFWVFNIGLSMYSLIVTAITFHISSIFELSGRGSDEAFGMFKYAAIIGVAVNLVIGYLSDGKLFKHKLHWMLIVQLGALALELLGVVMLNTSEISIYLIIVGHGVSSGVFAVVSSLVWPRYFGRTHLGQISGLAMSFMVFFSAIGASVFGLSFEVFGGYHIASYILIGVLGFFIVAAIKARFPHRNV